MSRLENSNLIIIEQNLPEPKLRRTFAPRALLMSLIVIVRVARTVHLRFLRVRLFGMMNWCWCSSCLGQRMSVAICIPIVIGIIIRTVAVFIVAVIDATGTGVGGVSPRVVRRGARVVAIAVLEDLETLGQDAHVAELDLRTESND